MTKFRLFLVIMLLCLPVVGEKLAVLSEISNPSFDIFMDDDRFYVVEGARVYVYSLQDYRLLTQFGRRGEGPGEFKVGVDDHVYIVPRKDHLVIESQGRLSYFTRGGDFLREVKVFMPGYNLLQPLGDKMVGFIDKWDKETKTYYKILNIFSPDLRKEREICRAEHNYQRSGFTVLRGTFLFKVHREKIFVTYWGGDFVMDCFDRDGKRLYRIEDKAFEKRKTSDEDIRKIHDYFKTYHEDYYSRNRDKIRIKEYWPAIGTFFLDGDRIYFLTYIGRKTGNGEEWLVYIHDISGKFIKKLYLPLKEREIWEVYPATFYRGKLFQLLENEETENWELHVTNIN
jgi:hypothetical protein